METFKVDINEIYKTIFDLEGPKHPIKNFDKLNEAANYIEKKLKSYGIKTEIQEFYIDGFDEPFKNVLGLIGDPNKPAIVLGSHYDTVVDCPGANDNLSAVAISLEVARVLSNLDNPPTVTIACFTLEEGHPSRIKWRNEAFKEKGWFDEKDRFTKFEYLESQRKIYKLYNEKRKVNKGRLVAIYEEILNEKESRLSELEVDYINTDLEVVKKIDKLFEDDSNIFYGLIGSTEYVKKVIKEHSNIKYILNLDTVGWIRNNKGTQKPLPIPKEMSSLYTCYKMDINETIGNFVSVIANQNAKDFYSRFLECCKEDDSDIPHFGLYLPFDMKTIRTNVADTLRSDHTPFWNAGIPGIFISDGANFRSPYYHTKEDNYSKIDYHMLEKLAVAILKTLHK